MIYIIYSNKRGVHIHRGAATEGTGEYVPPPTLKSRVTSYVLVPPVLSQNLF